MAKFKIDDLRMVPDFNGETLELDLSKDFDIDYPPLTVVARRGPSVPPVNRGGIWINGEDVLVQGGHFYEKGPYYNTSSYYIIDDSIPNYAIWKLSKAGKEWAAEWVPETYQLKKHSFVERTVSGAATCTNEKCYWFGFVLPSTITHYRSFNNLRYVSRGYVSSRTSRQSPGLPKDWSAGRRGMLIFDLKTKSLRNETIDSYGNDNEGFHFGTLHHIDSREKGLLISLMAEKAPVFPANDTSDDPYDPEDVTNPQCVEAV